MSQHFHRKKRFIVSIILGTLAGVITSGYVLMNYELLWGSAVMWAILTNRILLGFIIAISGAYTHHPLFGFKMHWGFRGSALGLFVSLTLAFALYTPIPYANDLFWYIFISGGLIGVLIDFFATKIGGEGKNIIS